MSGVVLLLLGYISKSQEANRLKANVDQLTTEKNALVTNLTFTTKEMASFLKERFPALEAKLDSAKIAPRRIETVVVQKTIYMDTTYKKLDMSPIVAAIKESRKIVVPFEDKTKCLLIKGTIEYDGQKLDLNIAERQFSSINEIVAHVERKRWRLLGIPTRMFGKKETKITVFNGCGESKTIILNKNR